MCGGVAPDGVNDPGDPDEAPVAVTGGGMAAKVGWPSTGSDTVPSATSPAVPPNGPGVMMIVAVAIVRASGHVIVVVASWPLKLNR